MWLPLQLSIQEHTSIISDEKHYDFLLKYKYMEKQIYWKDLYVSDYF